MVLSEAATEGTPLYVENRFEARFEVICHTRHISIEVVKLRKSGILQNRWGKVHGSGICAHDLRLVPLSALRIL